MTTSVPFFTPHLRRMAAADSTLPALFDHLLIPARHGFTPFQRHNQTVQAPAAALVNQQLTHPAELDAWRSMHEHEGTEPTTRWVMLAGATESWFLLVVELKGSVDLQVPILFRLPENRGLLQAIATTGALGVVGELIAFDGQPHDTWVFWLEPVVSGLRAQLRLPLTSDVRTRNRAWSRASSKELI